MTRRLTTYLEKSTKRVAGAAHAFRQLSGCETFMESHEGGYNNIS
jgi:hypothetical protein